MVVFTCNNCGDSLNKPKVAKHYQFACRNPVFVTCVDCHKDFRGDEYVVHTKCITENERYGGKDYVAKPSSNKGERKQQAWINIVQNVIATSNNLTVPERNLLNSISKHENIPRKKTKFINFIQNISKKVSSSCVESVWNKMEQAFKEATTDNADEKNKQNENSHPKGEETNSNANKENNNTGKTSASIKEEGKEIEEKKKSKKRQLDANKNDQPTSKRKSEIVETNSIDIHNVDLATNGEEIFSWKNTIFEIVSAKGEVSLKKLRKKVLAKYLVNFPDETAEKAGIKFEKKLKKVTNVIIEDNKVRLQSA